ncbi:MAG: response regulator [Thermoguttaceae bacterium]
MSGEKRGLGTSVPGETDAKCEEDAFADSLSPSATPLSILAIGDTTRREFREARACLGKWGSVADFSDPDSAAAGLAQNRISPDLLVVAQAFPGQFSHETIDRLRRLAPLARLLGLMGSWCEGEMRSGSPWPATLRTYWHQWPACGNRQLRRLAMGQSCSWALPLTASDEERLLADAKSSSACQGSIVIRSHSREMADCLSAACRRHGLVPIWQHDAAAVRVEGATAAIFECVDLCDDERDAMQRFADATRPAPLIALLSFPRIEDRDRAASTGASAVLSKPLVLEDLIETIDQFIVPERHNHAQQK